MTVSAIASQMSNTASPVAGVVTTFLAFSARTTHPASLIDILKVTVPAGIIGLLAVALWSLSRGKDLEKDPEFRQNLDVSITTLGKKISSTSSNHCRY